MVGKAQHTFAELTLRRLWGDKHNLCPREPLGGWGGGKLPPKCTGLPCTALRNDPVKSFLLSILHSLHYSTLQSTKIAPQPGVPSREHGEVFESELSPLSFWKNFSKGIEVWPPRRAIHLADAQGRQLARTNTVTYYPLLELRHFVPVSRLDHLLLVYGMAPSLNLSRRSWGS